MKQPVLLALAMFLFFGVLYAQDAKEPAPTKSKWQADVSPNDERVKIFTELEAKAQVGDIGATNVGTIIETYNPGQQVAKGDEKGYFRFGGSYVATIFEPGRIKLEDDLIHAGETAVEVYAKVGSPLGRLA